MKVELNIVERLVLMDLLPKEGNFVTLKIVRKNLDNLGFNDAELKEYDMTSAENTVNWDFEKAKKNNSWPKQFVFEDFITSIIKLKLKKLDAEEKLEGKYLSLYEKFIESPSESIKGE